MEKEPEAEYGFRLLMNIGFEFLTCQHQNGQTASLWISVRH